MPIKILLPMLSCTLLLSACQPKNESENQREAAVKPVEKQPHLDQFEQWKKTQNPEQLKRYQQVFLKRLKQQPTLYELTINSHPLKAECEQYRFALPPEKYWKNLFEPLFMIEQLQKQGVYAHYKIVSVYRSPDANRCVGGAKASQHMKNFAVDFQTLDESFQHYPDHDVMDQKLCQFWHQKGKKLHLGLGLYGKQRYHIDRQGYRTWGVGFRSVSSPCLKSNNSKP